MMVLSQAAHFVFEACMLAEEYCKAAGCPESIILGGIRDVTVDTKSLQRDSGVHPCKELHEC